MTGLLVHEWIETDGGAERVLDEMATAFPEAPIYCLWDDSAARYESSRVAQSWLARTPLRNHKALALPFMPAVWRSSWKGGERPDWILASSHLFAHHFGNPRDLEGVRKLAYVHTPARYLWAPESDARGSSLAVRAVAPFFRAIDKRRAQEVDEIATNSKFISERVERAWGRESRVIYPPVAVRHIQAIRDWSETLTEAEKYVLERLPRAFVFGASRLVSYKRLDVVIDMGEAVGYPVVIAGSGPAAAELMARAEKSKVPVLLVGRVSDNMLRALYQRATAFVFPSVEDFGIMPVEAMSLGTPVVVNSIGGARESVGLLRGGAVLEDFSKASLADAFERALKSDLKRAKSAAAYYFGEARFARQVTAWVQEMDE
jgi:glycosyltransferase involved in cell wall biosynthesis